MEEDEQVRKRRTLAEWLQDFLEADAAYYEQYYEPDDWDAQREPIPGGDEYFDDYDDDILDALLIGGLVAALAWLIYYRQQQQRAAEQRRQQGQGQGGEQNQQQPPPLAPGQQPDGGFFPQPGDPNRNACVAGGVGV